jgi:hypothetical protein
VGPACRRQFSSPHTPSLCLAGPVRQSPSHCPTRPFLLSLHRGPYLSIPPPPSSPWTGACALAHVAGFLSHDPRPRAQLPSQNPASAPRTPLTSFRASSPSLALCPEVRHPSPCPISLIAPCARPILPSPVLDRGSPPCSRGGRPI